MRGKVLETLGEYGRLLRHKPDSDSSSPKMMTERVRYSIYSRRMEAGRKPHGLHYRCEARTLSPGALTLAARPLRFTCARTHFETA